METARVKRFGEYALGVVLMFFSLGLALITAGFGYWRNSEGWDSAADKFTTLSKYGAVLILFATLFGCGAALVRKAIGSRRHKPI
jgi:uncharacterized membrane protein YeiB